MYFICFIHNALDTMLGVSPTWNHRNIESRDTWRPTNRGLNCIVYKTKKNILIFTGLKLSLSAQFSRFEVYWIQSNKKTNDQIFT